MFTHSLEWDELFKSITPLFHKFMETQLYPEKFPVWKNNKNIEFLDNSLSPPANGMAVNDLFEELYERTVSHSYCNGAHPHFMGYFHPRPLPIAIVGDAVASLLNQSPAAWRMGPSAAAIEEQTLAWLAEFVGYKRVTSSEIPHGIFTSCGSIANLAALKLARDEIFTACNKDEINLKDLTIYTSDESHYSITRAANILGIPEENVRQISCDSYGRIQIEQLKNTIKTDKRSGYKPMALVGLAGTTASGAIDPLEDMHQIANAEGIWFHIDGAAGSAFAGMEEMKDSFKGLQHADSLTIDPHKWMFMPYGIGCLLVRSPEKLHRSFAGAAHYWVEGDRIDHVFLGPEGARHWKSLGLWLAMKQLGTKGYSDILRRNRDVAEHLKNRIKSNRRMQLFTDSELPICCLRITPNNESISIDEFNSFIYKRLMSSGEFYITTCRPRGEYYLRISINNYSTKESHVEALYCSILKVCEDADNKFTNCANI